MIPDKVIRSNCCQCSTRCGVMVEFEDGQPRRVLGDPTHPVTKGFLCPRGRSGIEYRDHPERLTTPLRRVGARGEGRWEPVSWDDALDEIALEIDQARAQYGPESLAYLFGTFHGTDQGIGARLMNQLGSPNSAGYGQVCLGPRLVSEAVTFGIGPSVSDVTPGVTRGVVLWSQRPTSSNVPTWTKILAARRAGAQIVVIDPVETIEARKADLWLQIRRGTDVLLALGVLRHIITERTHDAAFVERWAAGFDDLYEAVELYTLDYVAAMTGLSQSSIVAFADIVANRPCAFSMGLINGMGVNAMNFERARSCLIAVSGNLNRAGANVLKGPPRKLRSKIDFEAYEALPDSAKAARLGAQHYKFLGGGIELVNEAQRRIWPEHAYVMAPSVLATADTPSVLTSALEGTPYQTRVILVQHANVVANHADSARAQAALLSENVALVVVQEINHNATTACADIVLPAAHWLEKPYMFVRGRTASSPRRPQRCRHFPPSVPTLR